MAGVVAIDACFGIVVIPFCSYHKLSRSFFTMLPDIWWFDIVITYDEYFVGFEPPIRSVLSHVYAHK